MRNDASAAIAVRLDIEGPLFASVEAWRRAQQKIPSRAEAVRLILLQALKVEAPRAAASDEASAA